MAIICHETSLDNKSRRIMYPHRIIIMKIDLDKFENMNEFID